MTPRVAEVQALAEKLKAWIRDISPGNCKMFSIGSGCECPLCLVDNLAAVHLAQAEPQPNDVMQEAVDVATTQLLIEVAFLVPKGTDLRTHPISAKLQDYKTAILRRLQAQADRQAQELKELTERAQVAEDCLTSQIATCDEIVRQRDDVCRDRDKVRQRIEQVEAERDRQAQTLQAVLQEIRHWLKDDYLVSEQLSDSLRDLLADGGA